jgi:hypothetical protein
MITLTHTEGENLPNTNIKRTASLQERLDFFRVRSQSAATVTW